MSITSQVAGAMAAVAQIRQKGEEPHVVNTARPARFSGPTETFGQVSEAPVEDVEPNNNPRHPCWRATDVPPQLHQPCCSMLRKITPQPHTCRRQVRPTRAAEKLRCPSCCALCTRLESTAMFVPRRWFDNANNGAPACLSGEVYSSWRR